jgi:hypothetical protein
MSDTTPALPSGYKLDDATPALPPGYKLDQPVQSSYQKFKDLIGPKPDISAGVGRSTQTPHLLSHSGTLADAPGDVLSTVGTHLKNAVVAPVAAVAKPPQTSAEKFASLLGPAGLGGYRMLAKPSIDAASKIPADWRNRDRNQSFTNALLKQEPAYVKDALDALPVVGPWAAGIENDAREKGGVAALSGLATDILAPKAAGEVVGAGARALQPAARVDEVIPGDTVTPRQRFQTAQARGVNLDRAQATGSPVATQAKRVTENSLGGRAAFDANQASNLNALDAWAGDLQNPEVVNGQPARPLLTREQFGNNAKQALAEHQATLNNRAGEIYDDLTKRVGNVQPDTTSVSDLAKKIVDENKDYYAEHPELLKGGTGQAWAIVNDLARTEKAPAKTVPTGLVDASGNPITRTTEATPRTSATWSDLHRLRSDLMDQYRSPDMVGSRAEGWLKQLVGGVDDSMTGAASRLSPADLADFRHANDLYSQMKSTYDDPTHPFYSIVRAPDGLTSANTLHGLKPEAARQFKAAANDVTRPSLIDQYQRQTISRLLDPNGDGTFDLKGLPARLNRQNMEQLQGILTPDQINDLGALARTSRTVHADSNPSGTAKVAQPAAEAGTGGASIASAPVLLATGHPAAAAGAVAVPLATMAAERIASRYLTNPERTAAAFEPGPNPEAASNAVTNAGRAAAIGGDITYSPDSHRFSPSQWLTANPDGNVQEAIDEAQRQGYEVSD